MYYKSDVLHPRQILTKHIYPRDWLVDWWKQCTLCSTTGQQCLIHPRQASDGILKEFNLPKLVSRHDHHEIEDFSLRGCHLPINHCFSCGPGFSSSPPKPGYKAARMTGRGRPFEIFNRAGELNPGPGEDRQWYVHSFAHWAIMTELTLIHLTKCLRS